MAELEATDVQMEYERRDGTHVRAIESLTLSIDKGRFVSIVGPSGCGKTTFLKIVNGLIKPTAGSVTVQGRPISSSRRDRAMVFQDSSLFPWFNVRRNVGYGLECRGMARAQIRAKV